MSEYSYDQGEVNYYENLLGRGRGDPDIYGYPGEATEPEQTDIE